MESRTNVKPEFHGQRGRILRLLWSGTEVSARELSAISLQYQARLSELRAVGFDIFKARDERLNGVRHCSYRLRRPDATQSATPLVIGDADLPSVQQSTLFTNEPAFVWQDPEMGSR